MPRAKLLLIIAPLLPLAQAQSKNCEDSRDLRLTNGHILTMDAKNPTVTEVTIRDGKFESIGTSKQKPTPFTPVNNLKGATPVPGLIHNNNHIVLFGLRPGYDTRLETAS